MEMKYFFVMTLFAPFVLSCRMSRDGENIMLIRADSLLYGSCATVEEMRREAPLFFHGGITETDVLARRNDTLLRKVYDSVEKTFIPRVTDSIKRVCGDIFYRVREHFRDETVPAVYTYISEWDFSTPVIYDRDKNALFVCSDLYLGEGNELYEGIYGYIRTYMDRKYLGAAVAQTVAECMAGGREGYRLLDCMVHHGKIMYMKSLFLGTKDMKRILDYTEEQLHMVESNECDIWNYYVSEGMLFTGGADYEERFFQPSPYSRFYNETDGKIPWGVGRYMGYKMVKGYMDRHRNVQVKDLMHIPADDILKKSGYNPYI